MISKLRKIMGNMSSKVGGPSRVKGSISFVFCVLFCSLEKNGKECNVLLGLISRQKLEKRMEKNVKFSF